MMIRNTQHIVRPMLVAALLVLGGMALLPARVSAHGAEFFRRGHDLQINIDTRWAGTTHGGYYPIRIRIVNRGPSKDLTLVFASEQDRIPEVRQTISAEQNATVEMSLSVPLVGDGSTGTLYFEHDGQRLAGMEQRLTLSEHDDAGAAWFRPSLLVISPQQVETSHFEQAGTALAQQAYSSMGYGGYPPGFGGGTMTAGDIAVIPPRMLPEKWIDYSGVDLVAVPLRTLQSMGTAPRTALVKWVHTGGNLIVYGVGKSPAESEPLHKALGLEEQEPGRLSWQPADPQSRDAAVGQLLSGVQVNEAGIGIAVEMLGEAMAGGGVPDAAQVQELIEGVHGGEPAPPGSKWPVNTEVFAQADLLLGRVVAFSGQPFPGTAEDWLWLLGSIGSERFRWPAREGLSARGDSPDFMNFLIPNVKGVPVYSFLAMITLFTLLIGPVNYFVLWRQKRLYLLVVTIPLIAFCTSLLMFGYSAIAQGFGVKSRTRSVTVLDQRAKVAVTSSRTALYAGLAPSGGLQFSPETAVYPIWPLHVGFESAEVDWTRTQGLTSGWLRSRTRTQFKTVAHREARGRLEFGSAGNDGLTVANGFEWDAAALIVSDDLGMLHFGRNLPAGGSLSLKPATPADRREFVKLLRAHPMEPPDAVVNGRNSGMFGSGSRNSYRRYLHGMYLPPQEAEFRESLAEQKLEALTKLETGAAVLPPRSFVILFAENPGVELGTTGTSPQADLHVLIGYDGRSTLSLTPTSLSVTH